MRNLAEFQENLENLYNELEQVMNMSELEACEFCGVDSKEDGIQAINEEIEYYESKIKELNGDSEESTYGLDPAFSSWKEVNSMFV